MITVVDYCLECHSRIFHSYRGITIAGGSVQNLGLSMAHMAFEQGGVSIVPYLL